MPKSRKPGSVRQKREVNRLFTDSYKGTIKAVKSINRKLDEGKPLSDEELRFLKRSPELIRIYENFEKNKVENEKEGLPEGTLRKYIEKLWNYQEMLREAFDNQRFVLDKEAWDKIAFDVGYYRCTCGELHLMNRKCIFDEIKEKYSKFTKEEN